MVNKTHKTISLQRQCQLLGFSRSGFYYEPQLENQTNLNLLEMIDKQFLKTPFYGSRQMMRHLQREGHVIGRHRIRRLMHKIGITAIYQKPRTSDPHPKHRIYPYLLRDLAIKRPNQVWCADITYIPMRHGFLYLVAIMDWYSRKVLSWRLSNSMDTSFCLDALNEAMHSYGRPDIFNTDQGSQFTSLEFTQILKNHNIKISMDGKGRWMDNVFIERLWRSFKYECVYLHAFEGGIEARRGISAWIDFYNFDRPHSTFEGLTPDEVYRGDQKPNPPYKVGLAPLYKELTAKKKEVSNDDGKRLLAA